MKLIRKIFFVLLASWILLVGPVFADSNLPILNAPDIKVSIPGLNKFENVNCTEAGCSIPWLAQYIGGIQRFAIAAVAILAIITMMIGGIIWLTAGGNQQRIADAKNWIGGSLLGLVLTLGAYLLLYTINPELTALKNVDISYIGKIDLETIIVAIKDGTPISKDVADLMKKFDKDNLISHTVGKSAETYKGQSCDKSIFGSGQPVEFFTTGYYKPPYENSQKFFCDVGLQCACPSGSSQIGPDKSLCKHKYKYCSPFPSTTPYCTKTASGVAPQVGQIAADGACFSFGDKVCLGGKVTLTVTDRGSAIKGRRFDIFSGMDRQLALSRTGVVSVTLGACH